MNGKSWTVADEARLKDNMDRFSAKDLAPVFGRSEDSIHCKMSMIRRGLIKRDVKVERLMELAEKRRWA